MLEKMDKGKPGTTQKVGTTFQNGNGLRPESLMLEANRNHWETDGQGGGRKRKKKKETILPTKEGSEALDAGVEPDPSHVNVSHAGRTSLPSISLLVPSPGSPSCP